MIPFLLMAAGGYFLGSGLKGEKDPLDARVLKDGGEMDIEDGDDGGYNDPREDKNTLSNKYKGKGEYEVEKMLLKKKFEKVGNFSKYDGMYGQKKKERPYGKEWERIYSDDFGNEIYVSEKSKKFYNWYQGE